LSTSPDADFYGAAWADYDTVNGFEKQNKEFNFRDGPRSRLEKIFDLTGNLLKLRKRKKADSIFVLFEFAQLGDISGDGALDLSHFLALHTK
jgi:hypothetical protein